MRKGDKVAIENCPGSWKWKRFLRKQGRQYRRERKRERKIKIEIERRVSLTPANVDVESLRGFCGVELNVTPDEMEDLCSAFSQLPEDCQNDILNELVNERTVNGAGPREAFLRARQLVSAYEAYSRIGCDASADPDDEWEPPEEPQKEEGGGRVN